MKKNLFITAIMIMVVMVASSFTTIGEATSNDAPKESKFIVTTDGNGDIANVTTKDANWDNSAWHIRNLNGYTNIRNRPNGKVCMRLKAHTQYEIYGDYYNGWILMSRCYNMRENYWIRFHSSSTGEYWIAASILY